MLPVEANYSLLREVSWEVRGVILPYFISPSQKIARKGIEIKRTRNTFSKTDRELLEFFRVVVLHIYQNSNKFFFRCTREYRHLASKVHLFPNHKNIFASDNDTFLLKLNRYTWNFYSRSLAIWLSGKSFANTSIYSRIYSCARLFIQFSI